MVATPPQDRSLSSDEGPHKETLGLLAARDDRAKEQVAVGCWRSVTVATLLITLSTCAAFVAMWCSVNHRLQQLQRAEDELGRRGVGVGDVGGGGSGGRGGEAGDAAALRQEVSALERTLRNETRSMRSTLKTLRGAREALRGGGAASAGVEGRRRQRHATSPATTIASTVGALRTTSTAHPPEASQASAPQKSTTRPPRLDIARGNTSEAPAPTPVSTSQTGRNASDPGRNASDNETGAQGRRRAERHEPPTTTAVVAVKSAEGDQPGRRAIRRRSTTSKARSVGNESSPGHERCHNAAIGDSCHANVMWAMSQGIKQNPEWYPGLTSKSSFNAFQALLHIDPTMNCSQPCKAAKVAKRAEGESCHDARVGDKCFENVVWVMRVGIFQHPEWYPGLKNGSSFAAFQAGLHTSRKGDCPEPCKAAGAAAAPQGP